MVNIHLILGCVGNAMNKIKDIEKGNQVRNKKSQ